MAKQTKTSKLHASFRPFRDYLITMLPLAALASYVYGLRVVVMLGIAAAAAELCDLLVALLRGRRPDFSDISSVTFAWIFTLMLPASASYGVLLFGVLAAVLLGKHAFGGYGCYPFHPSAFGFALTAVSFPNSVFLFPKPFSKVGLGWNVYTELYTSPAGSLQMGGVPSTGRTDLLLGDFAGPIGSTFCLVVFSCMVLLIVHGAMKWQVPVSFVLTCALWAFLFPRVAAGRLFSVMLELFCCGVPFAAAYLAAEPTLCPHGGKAKLWYGALVGVLTMLFNRFGAYENCVCFALLVSGPLAGWLDRLSAGALRIKQKGGGDGSEKA